MTWARVLGVLGLIVATLGLVLFGAQRLKADGAAARIAAEEKQHAKDIQAAAAESSRIQARQAVADRESARFRVQALADARDAAAAGGRLQQRFAAINVGCVPDHPAAAPGSPPASSAADLRADVLRRMDSAARAIAAFGDDAHGAGQQAQDSYPLTP